MKQLNWSEIKFTTTATEGGLINSILDRVERLRPDTFDRVALMMDLSATHANGTPLDFKAFLTAPDFDFMHDVYGINRHLNRKTGKLEGFFVPRMSKRGAK